MDNLKNWVNDNPEKEEFTQDLDNLWKGIEKGLDEKEENQRKVIPLWGYARWAAAIILLSVVGLGLFSTYQSQDSKSLALHQVSQEMAETEYYYSTEVSKRLEMIKTSGVEIDPLMMEDLAVLDSAYMELMKDLGEGAGNEDVVEAMIENYRLKLNILERILKEINKKTSI